MPRRRKYRSSRSHLRRNWQVSPPKQLQSHREDSAWSQTRQWSRQSSMLQQELIQIHQKQQVWSQSHLWRVLHQSRQLQQVWSQSHLQREWNQIHPQKE